MADETIAKALKVLADPTRCHIIEFLANQCCGSAAVQEDGSVEGPTAGEICCHITGANKITSTISHHLHELANAGLIDITRRGKAMVCTVRIEALTSLGEYFASLAKGEATEGCCC